MSAFPGCMLATHPKRSGCYRTHSPIADIRTGSVGSTSAVGRFQLQVAAMVEDLSRPRVTFTFVGVLAKMVGLSRLDLSNKHLFY